jgi:hypothetical protein
MRDLWAFVFVGLVFLALCLGLLGLVPDFRPVRPSEACHERWGDGELTPSQECHPSSWEVYP